MSVIADEEMCPCGSMKNWRICCKGSVDAKFFERVDVPSGGGPGPLDRLMKEGYDAFEDRDYAGAVEPWLTLWDALIQYEGMGSRDISDWDDELLLGEFLKNWCQDLEEALYNAALDDPELHEQKITFCDEFCEFFSDSGDRMIENMKRDAAESCFYLGRIDEGNRRFEELAEDFPDSQWVYIGWGDMYSPHMAPKDVSDIDRSRELYERALDVTDDHDEDEIEGRLSKLPAIE